MIDKLLSLLLREVWALDATYVAAYQERVLKFIDGHTVDFSDLTHEQEIKLQVANAKGIFDVEDFDDEQAPEDSVAVINLRGVMLKYGGLCSYGTESIAEVMHGAMLKDNVKAIVLREHTPGGETSSVFPLKEIMANRTKPVITLVDNLSASAGYYVGCMGDRVFAIDEMAEIGSIGAMASLIKDVTKKEDRKYEVIDLYPEESKHKHKVYRDALDGNTKGYIEEVLRPWAVNFQNHVKTMRGDKLNLKVEGLLEGKMFYAADNNAHGLIDGIKSFDNTIQFALDMAESKSIINSIK